MDRVLIVLLCGTVTDDRNVCSEGYHSCEGEGGCECVFTFNFKMMQNAIQITTGVNAQINNKSTGKQAAR